MNGIYIASIMKMLGLYYIKGSSSILIISKHFPIKGQIVNILDFARHVAAAATIQYCTEA